MSLLLFLLLLFLLLLPLLLLLLPLFLPLFLLPLLLRAACCVLRFFFFLAQFIKQFFPTRTVPKEVKVLTDKEIEETIKLQLEV